MRKLITIVILLFSIVGFAQKVIKNEVDEFTKARLKTISNEYLDMSMSLTLSQQIRYVDDRVILDLRLMPAITHIGVNDVTMIKLVNGNVINLHPINSVLSSKGGGAFGYMGSNAYGIGVEYYLSNEDISLLLESKIEKIRIYTGNSDYFEIGINDKRATKFIDCLKLLKL